jgi:hypothetical protein
LAFRSGCSRFRRHSGQQSEGEGNSGVFRDRMAHAGERVEGGSISPDLPQGLDYRTELLAGRARAAAETLEIPVTHSADKRTLTGVPAGGLLQGNSQSEARLI